MKYKKFLTLTLLASVLIFNGCGDTSKTTEFSAPEITQDSYDNIEAGFGFTLSDGWESTSYLDTFPEDDNRTTRVEFFATCDKGISMSITADKVFDKTLEEYVQYQKEILEESNELTGNTDGVVIGETNINGEDYRCIDSTSNIGSLTIYDRVIYIPTDGVIYSISISAETDKTLLDEAIGNIYEL